MNTELNIDRLRKTGELERIGYAGSIGREVDDKLIEIISKLSDESLDRIHKILKGS
jgi:hypothetical protein